MLSDVLIVLISCIPKVVPERLSWNIRLEYDVSCQNLLTDRELYINLLVGIKFFPERQATYLAVEHGLGLKLCCVSSMETMQGTFVA